jgi:membrane-bound lytic murein transglycosylase D
MVNGTMYYKIRQGDTLGGIAKKFRVTVSQLQKWNGLTGTNIYAGKNLRVSP